MNKFSLLCFAAIAVIVVAEVKHIRPKFTLENICEQKSCAEKCQTNGYESGQCRAGDMVMFCNCGDCVADKCQTSCAKDQVKGRCESSDNGRCLCE